MGKSKAMRFFERYVVHLGERLLSGTVTLPQMIAEYSELRADTMPDMTEEERAGLQEIDLRAHQKGAEVLAERGLPVPGNDPKRPN